MANDFAHKGKTEELDFVELLRSKTEESDMKNVLKGTMGGYTKQSVSNYIAFLRKNQQNMAETFYENQQLLYVEKEKLRQDNEKLVARLNELDTKYLDLTVQVGGSENVRDQNQEAEVMQLNAAIESLKYNITALDETVRSLSAQNKALQLEIDQAKTGTTSHFTETFQEMNQRAESMELELQESVTLLETLTAENEELKSKLDLSQQEAETRKTMLISNDAKAVNHQTRADELTTLLETQSKTLQNERIQWEKEKAAVEKEKRKLEEQLYLSKQTQANSSMSQKSTQDLDLLMKVNELTEQLALQTDLVASENAERTIREETIRSLSAQIEALKADSATFKATIENLSLQNEKLLLANSTMCTRMEDECRRTTALINEKSDISIEKLTTMRKLSEAETKIAMLEMELSRLKYEQN